MNTERDFYLRHHGGEIHLEDGIEDRDSIAQVHFARGKRYWLAFQMAKKLQRRERLLEIGCGHGKTVEWMAEEFGFRDAIGIDIALPLDSTRAMSDGVRFMQGDFNQPLSLEDGFADLLLAMMVIEHVFDPFAAMLEIRRLLSPAGVAVINLPLVTGLKNRLRLLAGKLPVTSRPYSSWFEDRQWDGNHLHYFTVDSARDLCAATGLEWLGHAAVGRFAMAKQLWPSLLASELTFAVSRRR